MNTKTEFSEYALRLIKDLLVVGVYLHREGSRLVNEHSLTQQQFVVLNEIVECDEINQKDIVGNLLTDFYNQIQPMPSLDKYPILAPIETITDDVNVEVVVLWVNALSLSGLVTLANFDRSSNNNVMVPFASGCQSIWTIPYKEKLKENSKAVVGCLDPSMRKHVAPDTISISLPSERFMEMSENIPDSFLAMQNWINLTS